MSGSDTGDREVDRQQRIRRVVEAYQRRKADGETIASQDVIAAHSDLQPELGERLKVLKLILGARDLAGAACPSTADPTQTASGSAAGMRAPQIHGYEIVRELSHGGQGIVYQALQKSTKRKVAIKILLEGRYASQSARKRFEREIELVAQLKHPNIVSIFHSDVTPDGHQFAVMDYIRGAPLNRHAREQKLGLDDALALFGKVCAAVQYAHQRGVIHRDLKPSNILVGADGEPKVLDFGLAKQLASRDSIVTISEHIVGTLPYMSPEQARGNPDQVDTRTDVYALGVVLYELLTGHYPYPVVNNMAVMLRHIVESEPAPPSRTWDRDSGVLSRKGRYRTGRCPIDNEVQTIVLRALAKAPQRRYQSAGELARDIEHYLAGEAIEAKRDSYWYVLRKYARRNLTQTIVAASVLIILLSAVAISVDALRFARGEQRSKQQSDALLARETSQFGTWATGVTQLSLFSAFLLEWRADCFEQARHVLAQMMPGAPEAEAASFLLDQQMTHDALLARIPADSRVVAYVALGERQLKARDLDAARDAFARGLEYDPNDWWRSMIRTRLRQIREMQAAGQSPAPD